MADVKLIRKQIKNVLDTLLPSMLNEALATDIKEQLSKEFQLRLSVIEKSIKDSLEKIDQRSKDSLGYLIRQSTQAQSVLPEGVDAGPQTRD